MAAAEADKMRAAAAKASLLGERNTAAHLEQEQYQRWLQTNANTLKTVNSLRASEAQSTLAASAALKSLNAELQENKRLNAITSARENINSRQNYAEFWLANTAADPTKNEKIRAYLERKRAATGYSSMGAGVSPGFAKLMVTESLLGSGAKEAAGHAVGTTFLGRMIGALGGHEGKMGMMQLIHTFRATFDALVAGINPWRVFLYEMPQLLQSITLIGGTALRTLMSLAAIGGTVAAIIGAPFLYLWRVNSIAGNLSKFKLPDLDTGYVARVDSLAESYRHIANAIRDTINLYNSATAASGRALKAMEAQFALQKEMDGIAKARAIQAAMGDAQKIAAIEKQYEQLGIQREAARLDAEKANKIAERAALEKEIAEKRREIAAIKTGEEPQHRRTLADLKLAADEAKKFILENSGDDPGWFRRQGRYLSAGLRSGGFLAGMINPQGGDMVTRELMNIESDAKKQDMARAQAIVSQYERLLNLEQKRNDSIKEREKLQTEAEKKSQRFAELSMEINAADNEKADILARMNKLADAKAGQADQNALFGGSSGGARDLTANQRIGAFAMSHQLTLVDLTRSGNAVRAEQLSILKEIAGKPPGIPGFN